MKIDKATIYKGIETRVGAGISEAEDAQQTAVNIFNFVWPLIQYLNDQLPEWIDEDFTKLQKAS